MRMSELQRKNIIDIENGTLIGKIIDLEINDSGKIVNLIVEKAKQENPHERTDPYHSGERSL